MALRTIIEVPDPILSQHADEVTVVDDEIRTLIEDMAETMVLEHGVGLAAPQVGVSLRVITAELDLSDPERPTVDAEEAGPQHEIVAIVNPEIVEREGKTTYDEGCLSVPELTVEVTRFERVTVCGLDAAGEPLELDAFGFPAVVLQHEIDHLDGITLLDRVSALKRNLYLRKRKKQNAAAAEGTA